MIRKTIVVVLALVAVSAIAAPALLGSSDRDGYEEAISDVLLDAEVNNGRAEGAPQQQVVNGWTTRDLLALQAAQQNDALELQSRQMALLLVIALLLAWSAVAATPSGGTRATTRAEEADATAPTAPTTTDTDE